VSQVSTPARLVKGDAEARYIETLTTALRRARLNDHYPDSRAMFSHISCLHPDHHRGLYSGVEVNLRSGLPTYKEWTRVQTDVVLAEDELKKLGPRRELEKKAEGREETIHGKQLRKHDYYSAIQGRQLSRLGRMDVTLRRVAPGEQRAWFHVVLDKLDASGVFVRYAIDLSQCSDSWTTNIVTLDAETAQHTEAFQSLIYQFTSLDAEFTYVKLQSMSGVEVEKVSKGTVGPVFWDASAAPPELASVWDADPDAVVATFALDLAADDLAADRDNDPLDDFLSDKLSEDARRGYDTTRARLGYKRFKDRKFVTTRAALPTLRSVCKACETKNVVYSL
jgi:hypothetical protein